MRQKMKGKWTHSKDWALVKQLIGSWESYWENSASFQLFHENWLLLNDILKSCVYNHGTCIMQPSFKVGGTCEIVLEKKMTWIYTFILSFLWFNKTFSSPNAVSSNSVECLWIYLKVAVPAKEMCREYFKQPQDVLDKEGILFTLGLSNLLAQGSI